MDRAWEAETSEAFGSQLIRHETRPSADYADYTDSKSKVEVEL